MTFPRTLDIFCRVIDNFGDVGVCWRLSRQMANEHGLEVSLWADNLSSLKRICSALDPALDRQQVQGVTVRRWPQEMMVFVPDDVADVVIEAFACHLPPAYIAAMAGRQTAAAWLNLEYLSAEAWVEGCHALPSPHTALSLTKHFYFPGFTDNTGGLLRERDLLAHRDAFQCDSAVAAAFFASLGVHVPQDALKVSLFCYSAAPVAALFEAMQADERPVYCLIPEGVATEAVSAFLQGSAAAGSRGTRGALTVQVLPFVDQDNYDRLLWACDLNFVRGEDSFVRAQWAGQPFIWHIYPQDEYAHIKKLDAFLGRHSEQMPTSDALVMTRFHLAWNGVREKGLLFEQWRNFRASLSPLAAHGQSWANELSQHGDLASNLLRFIRKFG